MAYFVKDQYVVGKFNNVTKVAAVINADSASDLPSYDNCNGVDGELTLGTIAFVADEVEFYGLTSDGTWHKHGEKSSSVSTNSVSPKTLQLNKSQITGLDPLPDMPDEYYTESSEPLEEYNK